MCHVWLTFRHFYILLVKHYKNNGELCHKFCIRLRFTYFLTVAQHVAIKLGCFRSLALDYKYFIKIEIIFVIINNDSESTADLLAFDLLVFYAG